MEIDLRDGRLEPLGSNDGLDVGAVRATGRGRSALTDRPGALFGATSRVSLFEIRLAVDAGLYELDAAPRSGRRD